ncbi:MAG: hypothetical protein WDO71_17470 [Bacteroidota bacterium]
MSRNNSYKAIFSSLLLLLTVQVADAQSKTSVRAAVDKNKILIGETIQLSLEADIPENEAIRFSLLIQYRILKLRKNKKLILRIPAMVLF